MDSVISFVKRGAALSAVSCTSAWERGRLDTPQARFEMQEIPAIFIPM